MKLIINEEIGPEAKRPIMEAHTTQKYDIFEEIDIPLPNVGSSFKGKVLRIEQIVGRSERSFTYIVGTPAKPKNPINRVFGEGSKLNQIVGDLAEEMGFKVGRNEAPPLKIGQKIELEDESADSTLAKLASKYGLGYGFTSDELIILDLVRNGGKVITPEGLQSYETIYDTQDLVSSVKLEYENPRSGGTIEHTETVRSNTLKTHGNPIFVSDAVSNKPEAARVCQAHILKRNSQSLSVRGAIGHGFVGTLSPGDLIGLDGGTVRVTSTRLELGRDLFEYTFEGYRVI